MNWMDKLSQTDECVTIEKCKISRLHFAMTCFAGFPESGLQHGLNGFAVACDIAGMKIITSKTEVLGFSRNTVQCSPEVGDVSLKQVEKLKYFGVKSVGRKDEELDVMFDQAKQVLQSEICTIWSS